MAIDMTVEQARHRPMVTELVGGLVRLQVTCVTTLSFCQW